MVDMGKVLIVSKVLRVSYGLTGNIKDWDSEKSQEIRNSLIESILEDECKDDPDSSRLERLKEFWLIKTEIK